MVVYLSDLIMNPPATVSNDRKWAWHIHSSVFLFMSIKCQMVAGVAMFTGAQQTRLQVYVIMLTQQ